jgi:hypothetical protein
MGAVTAQTLRAANESQGLPDFQAQAGSLCHINKQSAPLNEARLPFF